MADPIGPGNFGAYLAAFVDGELNAEQSAQVVRYMNDHPEACAELAALHRLRRTADRAVRAGTPPVPEELQRIVAGIMSHKAQPAPQPAPRRATARWAAVAAAVVIATGILSYLVGRSTSPSDTTAQLPAAGVPRVIPVSLESMMLRTHVDCSRFPSQHSAPMPTELRALADALKQDLASPESAPDLTALGFRLIGTGPCKSLKDTVHFLYAAADPELQETLSIFAQPATDALRLEPGKLYVITPVDSPHPALAWRSKRVTYFLVGDHAGTVNTAQKSLAAAVRS